MKKLKRIESPMECYADEAWRPSVGGLRQMLVTACRRAIAAQRADLCEAYIDMIERLTVLMDRPRTYADSVLLRQAERYGFIDVPMPSKEQVMELQELFDKFEKEGE